MTRRALITGITGQDGSYLAEWLLAQQYEVHGLTRWTSTPSDCRLTPFRDRLQLHVGDVLDGQHLARLLTVIRPHEVYHLAAQSYVPASWEIPTGTGEVTALGVTRMLEAIRQVDPTIRFYQASSSEMFGRTRHSPQDESTPFHPRSPYGVAKVYGHWITINFRESFGLFACSGILFNHESPRRGESFVTRKVTLAAARIKLGLQDRLQLGNLNAQRDWGFAGDYVRAMWMMLQQPEPDDYVIATGEMHSVRELVEVAFDRVGLDPWKYVEIDPALQRPAEVEHLCGNAAKAHKVLGWIPQVKFAELIAQMVDADLKIAERQQRSLA